MRSRASPAGAARRHGFGAPQPAPPACEAATPLSAAAARLQVLTEGAIRSGLLEQLDAAVRGDAIDIAAFALADRGLIEALLAAARRGVQVRLILDPSEDATSFAPAGLPNQPVASELVARSAGLIRVRWYRTHGERFHSALAMVYGPQRLWLTVGSANFTRRSLGDYDLEANLAVEMTRDAPLAQQLLHVLRHPVEQPRRARDRVHRGLRRLRRSLAG